MYKCSKCYMEITDKHERIFMLGKKWHRKCFTCDSCKTTLKYGEGTKHSDFLLCHSCSLKSNGPNEIAYFMMEWHHKQKVNQDVYVIACF